MSALLKQSLSKGEYAFSDADFNTLREMIQTETGISMGESKRQLIYRRISSRLKKLRMSSFSDYIELLESGDPEEFEVFLNTITTNLTSFFREKHHFEYLSDKVLPEIISKKISAGKKLRIWSAGCSTGQEPYSIAMTLREGMPDIDQWDAKVLCTDLDTQVLAKSSNGAYTQRDVDNLSAEILSKWFVPQINGGEQLYLAKPELKKLLVFNPLNLMAPWPMKGKFDVIFCRNVIIYFDKPTQVKLMERFAEYIAPGGYLILGHSESLHGAQERFQLIGKTIYQKVK